MTLTNDGEEMPPEAARKSRTDARNRSKAAFHRAFRAWAAYRNITDQTALSIQTGLSRQQINAYWIGKAQPVDDRSYEALADAFQTTPEALRNRMLPPAEPDSGKTSAVALAAVKSFSQLPDQWPDAFAALLSRLDDLQEALAQTNDGLAKTGDPGSGPRSCVARCRASTAKSWAPVNSAITFLPAPPCPRCGSRSVDSSLDVTRSVKLAEWQAFEKGQVGRMIAMLVLAVLTLGFWLVVNGIWIALTFFPRRAQKAAAMADVPRCTRRHCRECGLDFFDDEQKTRTTSSRMAR